MNRSKKTTLNDSKSSERRAEEMKKKRKQTAEGWRRSVEKICEKRRMD